MTVVPMKSDAEFAAHNAKATEAAAKELQDFFADYEALAAQRADVSRDMSDLLTVMKSKGYDVKALRRALAERKRDAEELRAEKEAAQMYMDLLR